MSKPHYYRDSETFDSDLDTILAARPINTKRYRGSPINSFMVWLEETLEPETVNAVLHDSHQYSLSYSAYRLLAQRQIRNERMAAQAS
jgi:hypothetical protein